MIPRATYRLQFHKDFPFAAALPLAPYLQRLGISHVYASPILKARPGSLHGYDVIDPTEINPELGGEDGFSQLAAELRAHRLGIILDIVPNHMAVDAGNRWWMDVLTNGRGSHFASYFDIDWTILNGKVLLAVLGKPYWETLDAGEVRIVHDDTSGKVCAEYFDRRLPLRPEDQTANPEKFVDAGALHTLLDRQHWRLAWWRTANDTINWRRFFDVPDLVALNQDHQEVFEATHEKIFDLYRDGLVDGVRVDHVDGLADPARYCRSLRQQLDKLAKERSQPDTHPYIVVEKILGAGESLAADWGVDGTTGYDFMNEVSALQHDSHGAEPLGRLWHKISERTADFDDEERLARGEIVRASFESALSQATGAFFSLAKDCKTGGDITYAALRRAIVRILQSLRVYRTYATDRHVSGGAVEAFASAVAEANGLAPGADRAAITFIAEVIRGDLADGSGRKAQDAVRRFNQLSAPVAAKAVEDTAFYRYGRSLSRNDVGFDPMTFARSPGAFHSAMEDRARSFPHALLASATHDHKRGEDVRARLAVLSEIPKKWEQVALGWMQMNTPQRGPLHNSGDEYQLYQTLVGAWPLELQPDDEGGIGAFRDRILSWRQKALREAKLHSSWLDPDEAYETADAEFIRAILDVRRSRGFLDSLFAFVRRIATGGALNSLVQATLRCTVPGVPDCYQGCEFWDFSLVDPDNRRPVDYSARMLALSDQGSATDLLGRWQDGRVKQALISGLLNLRHERPELFCDSGSRYIPLQVEGSRSDNVLAFARQCGSASMVIAVPLHCANLCTDVPLHAPNFWGDTAAVLPEGCHGVSWSLFDLEFPNSMSRLLCRDIFAQFPVAVLLNG